MRGRSLDDVVTPRLDVVAMTCGYSGAAVLTDVNVRVKAGDIALIVGVNGSGKSTLLRACMGLVAVPSGRVLIDGVERPMASAAYTRGRDGVHFLPQGRGVFVHLSVKENLELRAAVVGGKSDRRRAIERAVEVFPWLRGRLRERAANLSGGEQRMLAVAAVLSVEPRLAFLDEPSLGMSGGAIRTVLQALRGSATECGTAMVIAEQRLAGFVDEADQVYIVSRGTVSRPLRKDEWPGETARRSAIVSYWRTGADSDLVPPRADGGGA